MRTHHDTTIMNWLARQRQTSQHVRGRAVALTALGHQKADSWDAKGLKGQVLSILAESGPCTLSEITEQLAARGIPSNHAQLRAVIMWMIRAGYVRPVGADGVTQPNLA